MRSSTQQAPLLSDEEIVRVDAIYLRFTRLLEHARERDPLAATMHRVKLPPLLSESLAALVIEASGARVRRGGRLADLLATRRTTGERRVEVKGTGLSSWTMLTQHDADAAQIVWIDYAARIADPRAPVDVAVIDLSRIDPLRVGRVVLAGLVSKLPKGSIARFQLAMPSLNVHRLSDAARTFGVPMCPKPIGVGRRGRSTGRRGVAPAC